MLEKVLAVLAGFLAVASALYAYLQTRAEAARTKGDASPLSLLAVSQDVRYTPLSLSTPKKLTTRLLLMSLMHAVGVVIGFFFVYMEMVIRTPNWVFAGFFFTYGLVYYLLTVLTARAAFVSFKAARRIRAQKLSEVRGYARLVVEGLDHSSIQSQCIAALKIIGANIIQINSETGTIKATKRGSAWLAANGFADELTVTTHEVEGNTVVEITSDGVLPTAFGNDSKRHAGHISRLVHHLAS